MYAMESKNTGEVNFLMGVEVLVEIPVEQTTAG